MLFKDVKAGYPIYVLDRNVVALKMGKVKRVGMSRMENKIGSPMEMVVDIDVEINGETKQLTFKDSCETDYRQGLLVSTTKDAVIREVDAIKANAEESLSKTDDYKNIIVNCDNVLSELRPEEKEKKIFEDRLSSVEGSTKRIESVLAELVKELRG